jgi:hypothetical protein
VIFNEKYKFINVNITSPFSLSVLRNVGWDEDAYWIYNICLIFLQLLIKTFFILTNIYRDFFFVRYIAAYSVEISPTFRLWSCRRNVPPKHRLNFYGLHGVMSQKTEPFISISVRNSGPTKYLASYARNKSINACNSSCKMFIIFLRF